MAYVCKNRDVSGTRSEEIVVGKGVSLVSHGKRRCKAGDSLGQYSDRASLYL